MLHINGRGHSPEIAGIDYRFFFFEGIADYFYDPSVREMLGWMLKRGDDAADADDGGAKPTNEAFESFP